LNSNLKEKIDYEVLRINKLFDSGKEKSEKMKIVLDTNIIISALVSPQGLPAKRWCLVLDGKLTIVYDNHVLA